LANAAPTRPQRDYFVEVLADFQQKLGEVNRFVNDSVPKLNDTLRRHNAPTVVAGKAIELPR